jgi:3-methyladenine DNA glycosylase AlkD
MPGADAVIEQLESHRDERELAKVRNRLGRDEPAIGMRMGALFATAKAFTDLDLGEVDRLLEHPAYEPRLAAFCILDFKARRKLDDGERRALHDRYLEHHDRITTWDMVDRSAPRVVGGYLTGRPKDVLHDLAGSPDPLRRRTAITAPLLYTHGQRSADLQAGFDLAAVLASDPEPVVHNAVGIFIKHAGAVDPDAQRSFLDAHAPSMPRPALRLAIEKLSPDERSHYRS